MVRQAIVLAFCLVTVTAARAQDRIALVVGIDNYAKLNHLEKATNDARAVADTLQHLNFKVDLALDVDRKSFDRAISRFLNRITPGAIAYFHYSGHGVSIDNDTYLIPADLDVPTSEDREFVKRESIRLSDLIASIKDAKARSRVLVIDACRENPFASKGVRGIGQSGGIALIPAPEGTLVMYSAADGQTALDGLGANDRELTSVYTRTLLKHLATSNDTMVEIAREVRREVEDLAKSVGHDQRPAYYDELSDDLRLGLSVAAPAIASASPAPPTETAPTAPGPAKPVATANPPVPAAPPPAIAAPMPPGQVAALPPPARPITPSNTATSDSGLPPGVKLGDMIPGVALPGSIYSVVVLSQADPASCQMVCRADSKCASWTYARPTRCALKAVIPSQISNTCCTSGVERVPQGELREPPPVPATLANALPGIDMPGNVDYHTFGGPNATPEGCEAACKADGQCLAWTYVRPGILANNNQLCVLKWRLAPQISSTCCVSGIERQIPSEMPSNSGPLAGVNLPGSDYRNFELAGEDPTLCENACKAESQCLAWTYMRPGLPGPKARCWLKNNIPPHVSSPCCTSGIVRAEK